MAKSSWLKRAAGTGWGYTTGTAFCAALAAFNAPIWSANCYSADGISRSLARLFSTGAVVTTGYCTTAVLEFAFTTPIAPTISSFLTSRAPSSAVDCASDECFVRPWALTLKLMTVRPTCTALLNPGRSGVRYLTKTRVPNLL